MIASTTGLDDVQSDLEDIGNRSVSVNVDIQNATIAFDDHVAIGGQSKSTNVIFAATNHPPRTEYGDW